MKLTNLEIGTAIDFMCVNQIDSINNKNLILSTKIMDIIDVDNMLISIPMVGGKDYHLEIGQVLKFNFIYFDTIYAFAGTITEKRIENQVRMFVVHKDTHFEIIQRRDFFRFNVALPIFIKKTDTLNNEEIVSSSNGITVDISGNGARILSSEQIEVGTLINCRITLDYRNDVNFIGCIVWKEQYSLDSKDFQIMYGIRNIRIDPRKKEEIIRFIFKKQKEHIQQRK